MSDFQIDLKNFSKEQLYQMKEVAKNIEENGDNISDISDIDIDALFANNSEISVEDLILAQASTSEISAIPEDKLEQYKLYAQLINNADGNISKEDVLNISSNDGNVDSLSSEDIELMLESLGGIENLDDTINEAISTLTLETTGINISTSGVNYNPQTGEYTVVVEPYQSSMVSDGQGGKRYCNGTLWGITENVYGSNVDKATLYKYIQELNPQIKDVNLIYTGDVLKLPVLEFDPDGNIIGYDVTDFDPNPTIPTGDSDDVIDDPTDNTEIPTEIPEDPTFDSEIDDLVPIDPTIDFSEDPTADTVDDPTSDLVDIPTFEPTTEPTIEPTINTETPTELPEDPTTSITEERKDGILLGGNWETKREYSGNFASKASLMWNWATEKLGNENKANGIIDMPAFQGNTGDCVLISGIYAFASDDKGAQLLKDSITINKGNDGEIESYTVEFKGIGESYTITAKELKKATKFKLGRALGNMAEYSSGDDDMALLELAYKKCANESKNEKLHFDKSERKKLNGVNPSNLFYMLSGTKPTYYSPKGIIEELESGSLSSDTVAQIGFDKAQKVKDINGDKIKLVGRHAYSISEINDETVTLLNPWNTGESIILSRETFENLKYSDVVAVDLSKKDEE